MVEAMPRVLNMQPNWHFGIFTCARAVFVPFAFLA